MRNRLDIDPNQAYIARAYIMGWRNPDRHFQARPIIANFRDFGTVEAIMNNVKRLRGLPFSVDRDFPREIQEARSRLWPLYKETKRNCPRSKVVIAYPAKLIQDGAILRDELPDWNKVIGANRLTQLGQLENITNQYCPKPPVGEHPSGRHGDSATPTQEQSTSSTHNTAQSPTPATCTQQTRLTVPMDTCMSQVSDLPPNDLTINTIKTPHGDKPIVEVQTLNDTSTVPMNQAVSVSSSLSGEGEISNLHTAINTSSVDNTKVQTDTSVLMPPPSSILPASVSSEVSNPHPVPYATTLNLSVDLPAYDETVPKTLECDKTNPLIGKCVNNPRGRSRGPKSTRSERRSSSAVPYKRNASDSRSKTRANVDISKDILSIDSKKPTCSKNSSVSASSIQHEENCQQAGGAISDGQDLGQPPPQ